MSGIEKEEAPKWNEVFDADIDELGQSIQRVKDSWEMNNETQKDIADLLTAIRKLYEDSQPVVKAVFEQTKAEAKEQNLIKLRQKLTQAEAKCAQIYFHEIFSLFPDTVRPNSRRTFKAYEGINNLFNLGYALLSWKVHKALVNAKLEPYLGFLHSEQFGKPSLVCDFMEIYRFMIDNFLIQYYKGLKTKDFVMKYEALSRHKIGKREYLNDIDTRDLMSGLNNYFELMVEIPRMKVGKRQTFETLINEESLLLAKYLRDERKDWIPRLPKLVRNCLVRDC